MPCRGSCSISPGMSFPYAATTPTSGDQADSAAIVSGSRNRVGWRMGSSRVRATTFTGASVTRCPRPRGRSGCVTTPTTVCSDSISASRDGTAKSGVPKKTMRTGLPLAGFGELLDLPDDQIFLQAAQAIDEQCAVEVVHLVLEAAGEQSGPFDRLRLAVAIEPFEDRAGRTRHCCVEARHAQTALFFELHSIALDELGVDEHEQVGGIAADRDVAHEDPFADANLRRGEPDAGRGVHGLNHVVHEGINLRCDLGDRLGGTMEHRRSVADDRTQHGAMKNQRVSVGCARAVKRRATSSTVAARWRSISSIESPPNFSRNASARTNETIASPTTAAAGTAQTSRRSIAAGASCNVLRSTDRSGFISVAIGFMNPLTRRSWPFVTPPSRPPALFDGRSGRSASWRGGRISSWTREPGRKATSGPMPMPTALMAWMHIIACASRPSSLRSHWT